MSAGALALGGCGLLSAGSGDKLPGLPGAKATGRARDFVLAGAPLEFEVGDRVLSTWAYEGGVPGPGSRPVARGLHRRYISVPSRCKSSYNGRMGFWTGGDG